LLVLVVAGMWSPEAWLQAVGDFLTVRDPLERADAVIAISGDGTGERAGLAAQIVRQGYGEWFIASGSRGKSTWDMVDVALAAGIARERILVDDQAESTLENAEHSAALMGARGLRSAIVVSSTYHTRRAAWVFRSVFLPRGLRVRTTATENAYFIMREWWKRPDDRAFVLREYAKLLAFVVGFR
jgi:uncharacterized SAM-binding protein YcdF (DUF218 family)